jgi:flagellar biosynthetic protein FlhB
MSEADSQEKTEQPTGKRLEKARQEGQVPRSKELSTFAVLMGGALALLIFGPIIGEGIGAIFKYSFSLSRSEVFDTNQPLIHLGNVVFTAMWALAPFMGVMVLVSVLGPIGLGGWNFATKALQPKFSKLNPVEGIKRMFSLNSLVELGKGVGKTLVVATIAIIIFVNVIPELLAMQGEAVETGIRHTLVIIVWSFVFLASSMILITMVDVPFQLYSHNKKLKMTKQEVKDEFKDTEGKPEVKRKVRQLQYEMTQRRMLQEVPKADVIITNPTHYSVALKYDPDSMAAPLVVAKGVDHLALKIREIANAHGVEIVESPPLTRAVYYHAEVGDEIPSSLYLAVAQVLAYVFQLRRFRRGFGVRPGDIIADLDIPDDMRK